MTRYDTFSDISCVITEKKTSPSLLVMSISMMIESVLEWLYSTKGADFFQKALEQFQKEHGVVLSHESCYHQRLTYFNYYFLFKMQSSEQQRPIDYYFEKSSTNEQQKVRGLSEPIFSIFQLVKANKNVTILRDLLNNKKKYRIQNGRIMMDCLERQSIVQGFLFEFKSTFILGDGFLIHPAHILKHLIKCIKRTKKEGRLYRDTCLKQLSLSHLHYDRGNKKNVSLSYKFLF